MNYFFSSDYHFCHKNIIKYENRPFKSVEEMNETIVRRHNERVKDGDIVFFLGDLGFYASKTAEVRGEGQPVNPHTLLKQMKGEFYSVCGNHDTHSNKSYIPVFSITLKISGIDIQLIHNPDHANLNNDLIICGHVHGAWDKLSLVQYRERLQKLLNEKPREEIRNYNQVIQFLKKSERVPVDKLFINVSVETNNYRPYTFDEIKSIWDKWLQAHPRSEEIRSYMKRKLHEPKY